MTLCGYDVDCEDILDLTDEAVRSAHGVRLSDLDCAWKDLSARRIEPPSWAMMKRLTAAGRCRHHRSKLRGWCDGGRYQCDILEVERRNALPGEGH